MMEQNQKQLKTFQTFTSMFAPVLIAYLYTHFTALQFGNSDLVYW